MVLIHSQFKVIGFFSKQISIQSQMWLKKKEAHSCNWPACGSASNHFVNCGLNFTSDFIELMIKSSCTKSKKQQQQQADMIPFVSRQLIAKLEHNDAINLNISILCFSKWYFHIVTARFVCGSTYRLIFSTYLYSCHFIHLFIYLFILFALRHVTNWFRILLHIDHKQAAPRPRTPSN